MWLCAVVWCGNRRKYRVTNTRTGASYELCAPCARHFEAIFGLSSKVECL